MTIADHLLNEAALADALRAERLRSAGLEERIASLEAELAAAKAEELKWYKSAADGIDNALEHGVRESNALRDAHRKNIADLAAGFAAKMATALEAMEMRTAERIAEWLERDGPVGVRWRLSEAIASGAWRTITPTTCADFVAFIDGELPLDRAAAFREHLRTCEACATALPETMMAAARLSELKR